MIPRRFGVFTPCREGIPKTKVFGTAVSADPAANPASDHLWKHVHIQFAWVCVWKLNIGGNNPKISIQMQFPDPRALVFRRGDRGVTPI